MHVLDVDVAEDVQVVHVYNVSQVPEVHVHVQITN
jgi:hypothetical protein